MDLLDDDRTDQVRFQLPVSVGQRYGQLPADMVGAKSVPVSRITITAEIYMKGAIQSITSPTHPTVTTLDAAAPHFKQPVNSQEVQYRSPEFLERDFVLSVKADGLDVPRCFAERGPTGSVAMQLTLMPQVRLPIIPLQEYIFVVDQSGSMDGTRIEAAQRALVMLLRALPAHGTTFNIFSFGTKHDSLWEQSMSYDGDTLREAVGHFSFHFAAYN